MVACLTPVSLCPNNFRVFMKIPGHFWKSGPTQLRVLRVAANNCLRAGFQEMGKVQTPTSAHVSVYWGAQGNFREICSVGSWTVTHQVPAHTMAVPADTRTARVRSLGRLEMPRVWDRCEAWTESLPLLYPSCNLVILGNLIPDFSQKLSITNQPR